MTLVCRRWHDVSQRIINRVIHVTISPAQHRLNCDLFERLTADSSFRQSVKEFHVRDWYVPSSGYFQRTWAAGMGTQAGYSEEDECINGRPWDQLWRLAAVLSELSIWRFVHVSAIASSTVVD